MSRRKHGPHPVGVPLATGAREAFDGLCEELEGRADRALEALEEGLEEATQVLGLPEKYRKRLRTTSTLERLIQELRRREKVIRIFPHEKSVWRLLGAFLAERHEEWSTGRRYFRIDEYYAWKERRDAEQGEVRPAAYPRISDQREAIFHNFRDFEILTRFRSQLSLTST